MDEQKKVKHYVEWNEPFYYIDPDVPEEYLTHVNRISRLLIEDALTLQKAYVKENNLRKNRNFQYANDEEALEDFITVRFGKIIEVQEE